MEIYIKPAEKIQIAVRREVRLKDVAEVYAEEDVKKELKELPVFFRLLIYIYLALYQK